MIERVVAIRVTAGDEKQFETREVITIVYQEDKKHFWKENGLWNKFECVIRELLV